MAWWTHNDSVAREAAAKLAERVSAIEDAPTPDKVFLVELSERLMAATTELTKGDDAMRRATAWMVLAAVVFGVGLYTSPADAEWKKNVEHWAWKIWRSEYDPDEPTPDEPIPDEPLPDEPIPEPDDPPPPVPDNPYVPWGWNEGGKGGKVIRVTNLNKSGDGSLVAALLASGPRIIEFDVSGVIDLAGGGVKIRNSHLTVAGETSPDGIQVIRGSISVMTNNVVIRHMAFRSGSANAGDTMGIVAEERGQTHHVLIDHCSTTWGVDECLSVSGPDTWTYPDAPHHITISNTIIAEGLNKSVHPKGAHSKGTLINSGATFVELNRNLWAYNVDRAPLASDNCTVAIANCVTIGPTYHRGNFNFHIHNDSPVLCRASIVGNVLLACPDTPEDMKFIGHPELAVIYARDNLDQGAVYQNMGDTRTVWPDGLVPLKASETKVLVLGGVGTKFDFPHDERIIDNVLDNTGTIIDSQNDVGGYPSN